MQVRKQGRKRCLRNWESRVEKGAYVMREQGRKGAYVSEKEGQKRHLCKWESRAEIGAYVSEKAGQKKMLLWESKAEKGTYVCEKSGHKKALMPGNDLKKWLEAVVTPKM